jgi:hypothetical protein
VRTQNQPYLYQIIYYPVNKNLHTIRHIFWQDCVKSGKGKTIVEGTWRNPGDGNLIYLSNKEAKEEAGSNRKKQKQSKPTVAGQ